MHHQNRQKENIAPPTARITTRVELRHSKSCINLDMKAIGNTTQWVNETVGTAEMARKKQEVNHIVAAHDQPDNGSARFGK